MELQGLAQTVDQQLQSSRERTQQMAHQTLDKMLSTLNPPEEFRRRFTEASNEFISAAQTPWGGQEVADTLTKYYGAQFSDNELDQLLKFYKSPLGEKDVAAVHEAMGPTRLSSMLVVTSRSWTMRYSSSSTASISSLKTR